MRVYSIVMAWLWPRYQDDCYILRVRVPGMFPTNLLPDIIALVVKSILNFAHVVKCRIRQLIAHVMED